MDLGNDSHVHGEIDVMLSSAEVNAIIEYMKENGDSICYDNFKELYPKLYDKINDAAWEKIPEIL